MRVTLATRKRASHVEHSFSKAPPPARSRRSTADTEAASASRVREGSRRARACGNPVAIAVSFAGFRRTPMAVGVKPRGAHPSSMGLKTWWIGTQIDRVGTKLKRLRSLQKVNRDQIERLSRDRDVGPAEKDARRQKLEAEREKLTHEINRLHAEEERLKGELRAAGADERATA